MGEEPPMVVKMGFMWEIPQILGRVQARESLIPGRPGNFHKGAAQGCSTGQRQVSSVCQSHEGYRIELGVLWVLVL